MLLFYGLYSALTYYLLLLRAVKKYEHDESRKGFGELSEHGRNEKHASLCRRRRRRRVHATFRQSPNGDDNDVIRLAETYDVHLSLIAAAAFTALVPRSRRCRDQTFAPNTPGSVAEWLACWTQAQKSPASNRSRQAVG